MVRGGFNICRVDFQHLSNSLLFTSHPGNLIIIPRCCLGVSCMVGQKGVNSPNMRAALIARGPRAAPTQRARPAARPPAKCSPPSSCPLARPFPARRVLLPPASHSFSSAPLSFASTVCLASSFLLLGLPAGPRAGAPTHLVYSSSSLPPAPPPPFARPVPLPSFSFSPTPALPASASPFLPRARSARMEPLRLPAVCLSTPSPLRSLALARLDPSSPR